MKPIKLIGAAICVTAIGINTARALLTGDGSPDATELQNCCYKLEDQSGAEAAGSYCTAWSCPTNTGLTRRTYYICASCNDGYMGSVETITCNNSEILTYTCTKSGLGGLDRVCSQGQYSNGLGGCTACPSDEYGNAGTTSGTGATSVSECYIPANSPFSDETGSGVYGSDCNY